jgi:double-strand break repair protein MRE11
MPGEAVPKHVAILKIIGKEFKVEPIRLKTVRPFVMKEIVLAEERALKNLWKKDNNRTEITMHLNGIVEELIKQARQEWFDLQDNPGEIPESEIPRPLVRLRVDYTAPEGGRFDCENPQRFSNRFRERVANENDVIQFYRKKSAATKRGLNEPEMPDEAMLAELSLDSVKVEKLVREFLTAQSLTILPQNTFGDAVSQFVDKDDKHSMEMFVTESLSSQLKHLLQTEEADEEEIADAMESYRSKLEELFAAGHLKKTKKGKLKPKPDTWDSDMDGRWEDQPAALIHSDPDDDDEEDEDGVTSRAPTARGRGRGRGRGGRGASTTTRKTVAPKKAATTARASRSKKPIFEEEDDDEEEDVQMVLDDDEEDEDELFVKSKSKPRAAASRASSKRIPSPVKAPTRRAATKQSVLNFSQPTQRVTQSNGRAAPKAIEIVS